MDNHLIYIITEILLSYFRPNWKDHWWVYRRYSLGICHCRHCLHLLQVSVLYYKCYDIRNYTLGIVNGKDIYRRLIFQKVSHTLQNFWIYKLHVRWVRIQKVTMVTWCNV